MTHLDQLSSEKSLFTDIPDGICLGYDLIDPEPFNTNNQKQNFLSCWDGKKIVYKRDYNPIRPSPDAHSQWGNPEVKVSKQTPDLVDRFLRHCKYRETEEQQQRHNPDQSCKSSLNCWIINDFGLDEVNEGDDDYSNLNDLDYNKNVMVGPDHHYFDYDSEGSGSMIDEELGSGILDTDYFDGEGNSHVLTDCRDGVNQSDDEDVRCRKINQNLADDDDDEGRKVNKNSNINKNDNNADSQRSNKKVQVKATNNAPLKHPQGGGHQVNLGKGSAGSSSMRTCSLNLSSTILLLILGKLIL